MTNNAASLRALQRELGSRLTAAGFAERSKQVYFWPLREGVDGWLGINRATEDAGQIASLNPVIGIRHDEVERRVAQLSGRKPSLVAATFARPLGYFMPDHGYREWSIENEILIPDALDDMVSSIRTYGLAPMKQWADLSELLTAIERHGHVLEYEARDVPVILALVGKRSEAARRASGYLERMAGRLTYPEYRRFVVEFDRYLGQQRPPRSQVKTLR